MPFQEFSALPFGYGQSWRMETAVDSAGQPYRVHLTKGDHTLRMEVVLGAMADTGAASVVIIYLVLQRRFIEGVERSGIVG